MTRAKGGGDRFHYLDISCVPDSTFKTEIDALITAKTAVVGKLVSFTWGANYAVTSPASGTIPDGKIIDYEKTSSTYRLTCRIWGFTDQGSARRDANCIVNVPYEGTFALRDAIEVYDGTYDTVGDGDTNGCGACIAIDVPASGYADILL